MISDLKSVRSHEDVGDRKALAASAPIRAFAYDSSAEALQDMFLTVAAEPLSALFLFISPAQDFDDVVEQASQYAPESCITACTTAGEISDRGYGDDGVVAIGFPAALFDVSPILLADIHNIDRHALISRVIRDRATIKARNPSFLHEFGFLLADGLSLGEEKLMSALAPALGSLPFVGGSAGDSRRFEHTRLWFNGQRLEGGVAIFLVRSRCRCQVFRLDNFAPSNTRMVVTDADAEQRLVRRINDEPAAQEYARILGKHPQNLCLDTFAAHPVAIRIGSSHHIRAIQQVTDEGHLVFACAIDEGMVLNLAEGEPIVAHLERHLAALNQPEPPALIMGFECLFRRLASVQSQCQHAVSKVFKDQNLIGFSTYGEQYNTLHVNQTLVGVAFYPEA